MNAMRRLGAAAAIVVLLLGGNVIVSASAAVTTSSPAAPRVLATSAPASGADAANEAQMPAQNADLTHLVFTARDGLTATLVTPNVDAIVGSAYTKITAQTVEGAGIELAVDGTIVPVAHLGERAVDVETHTATYTFYAVPIHPGANDLVLIALGAGGLRGALVHARIFGAGRVAAVRASISGTLLADGRTPAMLHVVATDALGHSAQADAQVIVSVQSGDARLALPGDKHAVEGNAVKTVLDASGRAEIRVLPGAKSGNIVIAVTAGGVQTTAGAFVEPYLRRAFVTGLVSAGIGSMPGDADGDGNLDNGGSRRGRVALFGSGQILGRTSLTFAYDTASRLEPRSSSGPYVADPADRPYQTYGDASTLRDDTVSNARLFARLENGHNALTFGQFNADLGGGDAGATSYHQLLNGTLLQVADTKERVRTTLFNARNNVAYARQTFAVSGLASLPTILAPDIVVGSDIVTLVALDRHTGAVVTQTILQPNTDYVLDYTSGQLRFIQIPLPFDASLNPQLVVVQYQYAGGAAAHTAGGSTRIRFGTAPGALALRLGYVNDVSGAGNFSIFEQSLGSALPGGAWSLTHASAAGLGNTAALTTSYGQSTRFVLATGSTALRLTAGYDQTGAGYQNPFGGFATPGLTDMRIKIAHPLPDGEVALSYDAQANRGLGIDSSQSTTALNWKRRYNRLTLQAGIQQLRQNAPLASTPLVIATPAPDGSIPTAIVTPGATAVIASATQLALGLQYRIGDKSQFTLNRTVDIAGAPDSQLTQPAQTTAGIDLAISRTTHAYLRSTWSAAPQIGFAQSSAPYTAESGTQVTTFGIDRIVSPATTVTTQWALQNTGNVTDVYSTNGVRERFEFSKRLKGDAFFQTSRISATSNTAGGFSVYGLALAYGDDRFHASSAFQKRAGSTPGFDLQLGAGGALSPDVSLLGHMNSTIAGGFHDVDTRVGLAWRPHRNDRGATLLELERHTGNLNTGTERSDTLSLEQVYRPTTRLELDGRLAGKIDGDDNYAAHTMLLDLRAVQKIGSRTDIAVETRTLRVPGIAGATQTAFGVEGGLRIAEQMRFALGYHFSGAADPALVGAPTRKGVYATATSVIDRILGWGR